MCLGRKGEDFVMMPPPIDGYKRNHNSHDLNCLYQAIKGTTSSHLRKKKVVCYVMLLEVGDKLIGSLNTSVEFITSSELISNLKVEQLEKQEFFVNNNMVGGWINQSSTG